MCLTNMPRARGFTLIELVFVMLIISFGLLGLTSLFSGSATSLTTNETLQQAAQYAQECAENLIAKRRANGFAQFKSDTATPSVGPAISCGLLASTPGFTRTPNDSSTNTQPSTTGTTTSACPNLTACRTVTITVASTANPAISSSITVMLVDY